MTELKMTFAVFLGTVIGCFIWECGIFWIRHFWTKLKMKTKRRIYATK